ncbi:MAG: maleylpyruvate isomerase family mycothiol-dependent enzyme [Actinobacteria bacterium]|nr:maleylpyruvate isomerase family mycothiol-dependent enzyme [Actinomycetota bacterium]
MDSQQYFDAIRADSARLVASSVAAGLDTMVPSCPEWTVADLLGHVGRVQRWQADIVARRVQEAEFSFAEPPTDPAVLVSWVQDATALLLEVFAAAPADTPLWTFVGPGVAGFWVRRQAHEVSLHRVDADLAAGIAPALDGELATDAIDEFLDVVVQFRVRDRMTGTGETVHLHRADGDGEWLVRLTAEGPEVERTHAKGDVAARGSASDLLLALRGRVEPSALEVFGDEAVLLRFIDLSRL